ncbi:hypothetical protein CL617_02355 [archaeon]|nr:hypothetical protein [archaeon]|tara:strand:- start:15887 stop:16417 length:531 start_codon:yes stop_codon:yes gene_type:complete
MVEEFIRNTSVFLIKLIISGIIVIIGLILGRFAGNLTKKIMKELEIKRLLEKRNKINIFLEENIADLVKYLIYLASFIVALIQLGLFFTVVFIFIGLIIVLLTIFSVFTTKDLIPNFASRFKVKKLFNLGSKVKINNLSGVIMDISLHETLLKTKEYSIYIPNSLVLKTKIKVEKI